MYLASRRPGASSARPISLSSVEPCHINIHQRERRRRTRALSRPIPTTTTTNIDRRNLRCSSSNSTSSSPSSPLPFVVRPATPKDRWHLSQVHCASFFPGLPGILEWVYRLDRAIGLETGEANEARGAGRFACLVATTTASNVPDDDDDGEERSPILHLPRPVRGCFLESLETGALRSGILGSICVDAQGCQLPARKLPSATNSRNAAVSTFLSLVSPSPTSNPDTSLSSPPRNPPEPVASTMRAPPGAVAYLSNLAVAPTARKLGVARALLRAAEREAWGWGCRSVALHVSPQNAPAVALYKGANYRVCGGAPLPTATTAVVDDGDASLTLTGGPLTLMLKVAPREVVAKRAAEAAAAAAASRASSAVAAAVSPATT